MRVPLGLVLALCWLDLVLNLRYPAQEATLWYLVPAFDLLPLLGLYAVFGRAGRRMPAFAHWLVVAAVLVIRCLRFADGLKLRYFHRPFNAYLDLPLVPELGRLLQSTLTRAEFGLLLVFAPLACGALAWSVSRALRELEYALREPATGRALGAAVLVYSAAAVVFFPQPAQSELRSGGFGRSALPRISTEIDFALHASERREQQRERVDGVQRRLSLETELELLDRQNVLFFLIESYGETVLERTSFADKSRALYAKLEAELTAAGFHGASAILDSPTYGGGSWLAHATLATGVRIDNQLDYEMVASMRPRTMAQRFRDAGYRTVSLQPGTTRPLLQGDFLGFEKPYYAWSLEYRGPKFAWATMPDQYVLDFLRRRELETAREPLFVSVALVSSHAPWTHIPPWIDDWSSIRDGSVFHQLPARINPVDWSDLGGAADGYFASIHYDLELITRFLLEFVKDDSLVLLAGDHQPAPDITLHSPKHGVPVHVLSRRAAFLEPFLKRGYEPGLKPSSKAARLPMNELFVSLLGDFSGADPGRGGTP